MQRLIWTITSIFIVVTGLAGSPRAQAEEPSFDAADAAPEMIDLSNVYVHFKVRVLGLVSIMGRFDRLFGAFTNDTQSDSTAVRMRIDASSVNTDDEWRDDYLRGPTFFATDRYPDITFSGLCLSRGENGGKQLVGKLNVRGRSRPVVFDIESVNPTPGHRTAVYQAKTVIRRSEFGLNAMEHVISDEVEIMVAMKTGSAD
jgi:polyisoprenoid-binding protein YceI